jgi:hypothetical protein
VRAYGADIIEPLRVRPTLGKDATAPRGLLDLPYRVPDTRPLKAKLKPTDSGKQTTYLHHSIRVRVASTMGVRVVLVKWVP